MDLEHVTHSWAEGKGRHLDQQLDLPESEGDSSKGSDAGESFRNTALHGHVGIQDVACPSKVGTCGVTQMIISCCFFQNKSRVIL